MNLPRKKVYRAGLIPFFIDYNDFDNSMMMFMVPSDQRYGGSQPQIAKGQIEPNEEPREAALREAQEELGLLNDNICELIDCGLWLGRTYLYVAIVDTMDSTEYAKPHFETESVIWMTNKQFQQDGRPLHAPVVDKLFELVRANVEYQYGFL